ncbi:VIT family protein [Afipia sp. GAS231]|nr:VIT family protein [Afipia sp. GAS231]
MAARIPAGGKHESQLAGVGYPAPAGTSRCPLFYNCRLHGRTHLHTKPADCGIGGWAVSMAAGDYVTVSSQSDTEQAGLARERRESNENPAFNLDELAEIYVKRGVAKPLARQAAEQLMAKNALTAHASRRIRHRGNHHSASRPGCGYLGCMFCWALPCRCPDQSPWQDRVWAAFTIPVQACSNGARNLAPGDRKLS